jgi:hypothetical protein
MGKWINIIILMIIIAMPALGSGTIIQISTDNTSWTNITSTYYGGSIDETNQSAYIQNLNASTTYYLRAMDNTHTWNYTSIQTLAASGGEDEMANMLMAVSIVQIFIITLFMILGIVNTFRYFKWASFIMAFYETFILLGIVWAGVSEVSYIWVLHMNFYLTGIVGFGLLMLSFMFRSIDLMTHDEQAGKSQLGMNKFDGNKFT